MIILFIKIWKARDIKDNTPLEEIKKCFAKTHYFDYLCKYLVLGLTVKEKAKKNKNLESKLKEYEELSNKLIYFDKIKKSKIRYLKELEKITLLLNNRNLLRKEYMAKNLKLSPEKRIATIRNI